MNALGFASPWMLLALAAAAGPVLLHALTRPRPRTLRFPPFRFLVEAGSGQQSLHRLRLWLLLALRTAAVLALVLLFSLPFVRRSPAETLPGRAERAVLVVDSSLSLRASPGGVPLFAKARAEAAALLRRLEPGSSVGLIFLAARPRAALPGLSGNVQAVHQALLDAQPTLEAGDPGHALSLAAQMLRGSGNLYVFSDFQRTNWASTRFDNLEGISCFLRPVTDRAADNLAVTAVRVLPAEPVAGETIEIACTLFNSSAESRQEILNLEMKGISQEARTLLRPFSSGQASFTLTLPSGGTFPGSVRTGIDPLPEDNTRYFTVRVRRALHVLILSDAESEDRSCASFFMGAAIRPSDSAASSFQVLRRHSQDVDRSAIEAADILAVVSPATLTRQAAELVAYRVARGAHLLCLLDGPTAPALIDILAEASKGALAPPFRLLEPARSSSERGDPFGTLQLGGTPLKLFADPEEGDLSSLRFRRHFATRVQESRRDEILIRFPDDSAALALSPAGRGVAVFANFSIAPRGGNLIRSPLFAPFMAEVLRALRRGQEQTSASPGIPWELEVPEAEGLPDGPGCRVIDPAGQPVEHRVIARGRSTRLALPPPALPGHYAVRSGDATAALGVVNVDPRESDTRPLPLDGIETTLVAEGRVSTIRDDEELLAAGRARPLWPWLAAAAAAALGLEMVLLAISRGSGGTPLSTRSPGKSPLHRSAVAAPFAPARTRIPVQKCRRTFEQGY
ncbi:MAG: VWA domain-containing protein [Planctomycetes bacterium]|nr:VWA domain-containing protein [Planctomycetota bacterium]